MAAATLSLCSSLTPKLSQNQASIPFSHSRTNLSFLSHSLSSPTLSSRKQPALSFTGKATDTEDAVAVREPEIESPVVEIEPAVETPKPKREEIFAVVMVGGRQYIVFPGRYIYTQRLKGANVNDKTLDKNVIVFKYKKKKNYRRNIGHIQPITRIRIRIIDLVHQVFARFFLIMLLLIIRKDGRIFEFATMMRKGNPGVGSRTLRGNLNFNIADAFQGKEEGKQED